MIRLSQYTIIDISTTSVSRDLDADVLHLYSFEQNHRTYRQFIQNDAKEINSREFAYGPYIQNIWLNPTPYFYPEENITPDFHENSTLQNVLSQSTLPTMEYKTASLYLSQGFGYDVDFRGLSCRIYVKLQDGREVTLASIYDLATQSKITAAKQVLYESQIFNTKIEFEIPDIDYILNSNDADISALRTLLFGTEIPDKMYISYSGMRNENIDDITIEQRQYKQFNLSAVHTVFIDMSLQGSGVYATLHLNPTNSAILSVLQHDKFSAAQYLDKFKDSEETYTVQHTFVIDMYTVGDALIGSSGIVMTDPISQFAQIPYRPIITDDTSYFEINATVRVVNDQTGLVMTHTSSIVISDAAIVERFTPEPSLITLNLTKDTVFNQSIKTINEISSVTEAPNIIQITKPVFVSTQQTADVLELLPADFTTTLSIDADLSLVQKTYLQIDAILIENIQDDLLSFTIPKKAFYTKMTTFYLLASDGSVITTGKLIKKQ